MEFSQPRVEKEREEEGVHMILVSHLMHEIGVSGKKKRKDGPLAGRPSFSYYGREREKGRERS